MLVQLDGSRGRRAGGFAQDWSSRGVAQPGSAPAFSKFVSAATLVLGLAMAGWTSKRQALHDTLGDAVIVLRQSAG
jgi:hypothetical protein